MRYNWDKQNVQNAVESSANFSDTLRALGIPVRGNNLTTLKKKIKLYGINTEHFIGRVYQKDFGHVQYVPAEKYLNNTRFINSWKLKEKLIKEGVKRHVCERCGVSEWMGEPVPLQLHHINGDNTDNRIENIQILCPNCHAQTENYRGGANRLKSDNYCPECGRKISKNSKYCPACTARHRLKLDVPKEQLLKDLEELKSYVKVAKKYGVSDKTIKKKVSR